MDLILQKKKPWVRQKTGRAMRNKISFWLIHLEHRTCAGFWAEGQFGCFKEMLYWSTISMSLAINPTGSPMAGSAIQETLGENNRMWSSTVCRCEPRLHKSLRKVGVGWWNQYINKHPPCSDYWVGGGFDLLRRQSYSAGFIVWNRWA